MIPFLKSFFLIGILIFIFSCEEEIVMDEDKFEESVSLIDASEQRPLGNAQEGLEYLIYGDYISSGFPYDFFTQNFPTGDNALGRSGLNADIPFSFNAVEAENGVSIVAPNCLQCHAQYFEGELVLGLGNYLSDYTTDQSGVLNFAELAIRNQYGEGSAEWLAFEPFSRASKVSAPYIVTEVRGVNPADKLTAVLGAHRDAQDLTWLENPQYEIPEGLIPTDVPALWLAKKKNALYYTGSGRGDKARLISAAELLTLSNADKASAVDDSFVDVLAFIESIEAPEYKQTIDETLAIQGEALFNQECSKCHGTYGSAPTFPNLLVDLDYIGTDRALAEANFAYADFLDWYNQSWFSQGSGSATFEKTEGYIAPPLDGIWSTAPYLHNGSVPDLYTLLKSEERPQYWKRGENYNYQRLGWDYTEFSESAGSTIYNTTLDGYANQGHNFGDVFSDAERMAVIEYLKSI